MSAFRIILLVFLVAGCGKGGSNCNFPSFGCLQGKWIEKEHTDSLHVQEYIEVYVENNRQIFYDWTAYAQLQSSQLAIGKYYFSELPGRDSIDLTSVYSQLSHHRYVKMISNDEIEIDYELPPASPVVKKRYVRG